MSNKLLIKGGKLLSKSDGYFYEKKDILIIDGKITEISNHIESTIDADIINLNNEIISPGFIDVHGHFDPDGPLHIGLHPDVAGVRVGNCAVIDAGSTGAANFEEFERKYIKNSITRVYALLNLAYNGIDTWEELSHENNLNIEKLKEMIARHRDTIIGIKVRSDCESVGKLGIKPFKIAHEVAHEINIPFVSHVGEFPPKISDMLDLSTKGDLITHCYNNYSPNGIYNSLVDINGNVLESVWKAKKRGALFDVGHGGCSFSFDIAHAAFEQKFYPDMIGTDIYSWNFLEPVWSLSHTMNKIMHLGMDIIDCVQCVTSTPADFFKLDGLGHLQEGYNGDLTIFHLENTPIDLVDSKGKKEIGTSHLVVDYVTIGGKAHHIN